MDNMENEHIRGTEQIRLFFLVVRLRWFANCNVPREGSGYIGRRTQRLELADWRPEGTDKVEIYGWNESGQEVGGWCERTPLMGEAK